ncbi:hypothetical protein GLYMA_15G049400v4 [Glycine max]|uniref:Uncharacterized protein n=1 Tax=Glycine max TaxID=3847 RepID=A0A0R0G5S8_SOYBN|nr:hypothetical protein GYH30_041377 [Glycine max]KRH10475.1 hypothetical protein GLYMA_15G049400v4 [Glycine max]
MGYLLLSTAKMKTMSASEWHKKKLYMFNKITMSSQIISNISTVLKRVLGPSRQQ